MLGPIIFIVSVTYRPQMDLHVEVCTTGSSECRSKVGLTTQTRQQKSRVCIHTSG